MIIVDCEMPESCMDCPMLNDAIYCQVTGSPIWNAGIEPCHERLPDCPILAELYITRTGVGIAALRFSHQEKLTAKINELLASQAPEKP